MDLVTYNKALDLRSSIDDLRAKLLAIEQSGAPSEISTITVGSPYGDCLFILNDDFMPYFRDELLDRIKIQITLELTKLENQFEKLKC